ncbi:AsmA-like C-terminal domain-containing protein, partial [Bacillus sp. SIMBA_161]
ALGLTTKGEVDLDAGQLDLTGVVVPAASTNRVLADIPVLGKLLTGGEGEGLFAVTYDVTGPLNQPKVDVNPLSALAPGFLRGLFGRL